MAFVGFTSTKTKFRSGSSGWITVKFAEVEMEDFNYSFSGIKTSILYTLRKEVAKNENYVQENLNDICASIQKSLIDILIS